MTIDRLIHLTMGIVFFAAFLKLSKHKVDAYTLVYGGIAMGMGTWVSDWDLFLGIGYHRSPITHSVLPAVLLAWLALKAKLSNMIMVGFCLGLSSHLFWDIIMYGNVHWIKGGNNDRLFLLVNSVLSLLLAFYFQRKNKRAS